MTDQQAAFPASGRPRNASQIELLRNIQRSLCNTLKISLIITDKSGKPVVHPEVAAPFRVPGGIGGDLWKCCKQTIEDLGRMPVHDEPVSRTCKCGHEVALIRVAEGSDNYNLFLLQLISENSNEAVIITRAQQNGYSAEQALAAFHETHISNRHEFMNVCQMLHYQSRLLSTLSAGNSEAGSASRTATEEALIKAKNEAEESSRLKSSLLANMSHELRTPMTGILGFSEILHEELEDSRLKNMASTIYKSANRLMTTLNSIMDLSAIESNRTNLNLRPVNVKSTFMNLLRGAYNIASDKGLYIRTALPPNINVIADDKLLGQLLHHLIDNAIKFTIDGGVSISAYAGLKDNSDVVIKISDTGIGIAPQHHKLIFEEFRQVSEGLSRTFEGSGLGLSLVMKISNLLNAKVWVESVPEKGSDFYVSLPSAAVVNEEIPVPVIKEEPVSTLRLGRGSVPEVLIVEDNEINRRLAALYLREICNIDMAENGYIALNKIREKKYDAILMDINLGAGPNGIHVAQNIRKIDHYQDVPIIAVTGYTMQGDREKLLASGCTHYVAKPYDKKTLIKLFSGVLYQSKSA